jgi:DNA polymerase III gamma/tau subunit
MDTQFTRFSHAEHDLAGQENVCTDCHQAEENGEFLSAYVLHAEPASYVSSFAPIEAQNCSSCHAQNRQASEQCLNCHNYHVVAQSGSENTQVPASPIKPGSKPHD